MYGLKQAARLANDKLRDHLASFGYFPDSLAPDVWKHTPRATVFFKCVDNFGVKFVNQNDVSHLTNTLRTKYKAYIGYEGTDYRALKLSWNYDQGYVDVSMANFVPKTLTNFNIHLHGNLSMIHIGRVHPFMARHNK